jgi:hypothetical protein
VLYYDKCEWNSSHNAKDLSDFVVVDLLIQSVWKQAKLKEGPYCYIESQIY